MILSIQDSMSEFWKLLTISKNLIIQMCQSFLICVFDISLKKNHNLFCLWASLCNVEYGIQPFRGFFKNIFVVGLLYNWRKRYIYIYVCAVSFDASQLAIRVSSLQLTNLCCKFVNISGWANIYFTDWKSLKGIKAQIIFKNCILYVFSQ